MTLKSPVAASRGELVHLQVFVSGTVSVGAKVSARVDGGVGPMTVRSVSYHNLTLPVAAANGIAVASKPGLFPDALLPLGGGAADELEEVHLPPAGAPQVFWLTVLVPRTAESGLHKGSFNAEGCTGATFSVLVSRFSMPAQMTQLTGSQFEGRDIEPFTSPECQRTPKPMCYAPETAMNFFRSHAAQHSNSQVWFELNMLPWAPTYYFDSTRTKVTLNTTLNDIWWPKALELTGSTHWRMPFSERIRSLPHHFETNATWIFKLEPSTSAPGGHVTIPMFGSKAGELNPQFVSMFKVLFKAVMNYLDSRGWADDGSWIQVIDEPEWQENTTLANTLAIMKLYKEVDPRIKIFQTRWPTGGGAATAAAGPSELTGQGVPPYALPLLDLVDWWCPHVCQWTHKGVPEAFAALRKQRARTNRPLHITVYDNGVPIIESPWERLRTQPIDVWISNGTLDGTLSWYSVNSYARSSEDHHVEDPWLHPYPSIFHYPNNTAYLKDPAGWGYLLYPQPESKRLGKPWSPVESIRWVMTGAGIQDAEYLYALQKTSPLSRKALALLAQARTLATHFPKKWNPTCTADQVGGGEWGDDGYSVDDGGEADGSSVVNTWRLAMGEELGKKADF